MKQTLSILLSVFYAQILNLLSRNRESTPVEPFAGHMLSLGCGADQWSPAPVPFPDTMESLYNPLLKWLGVKAQRIYEWSTSHGIASAAADVEIQVEGGKVLLTMLGYRAEISIAGNRIAMTELLFKTLFSWMSRIWESVTPALNWNGIPDLRDESETDVDRIGSELETMKQRIENNQWLFSQHSQTLRSDSDNRL